MALYLNNLDLNGNQLQKAVVHPLGTAPASAQEGQIYYDTGDNAIYVNTSTTVNSPNWVNMQIGDVTGVSFTTDDSTTISDTSGDAAFTIAGGTGITTSSTGSTVTITVGTLNQDTTGSAATLTTARNIGGVSFNGSASIDLPGVNTGGNQDTTGNAATATKITTITNSDIVQLTATQTLTNKTIAASQVTEISNLTAVEGAQLENIGSTTISATQWGYLGAATGAITNTDVDVSVANLKTALGDGFPDNTANIGDSDDTITVPGDLAISGDLTVTGDTITTNVTTVSVKDPMIRVANNNAVDSVDFGLYGTYQSTIDGTTAIRFSGVFRDASEDTDSWTFFKDLSDEPGATTVNTAHSTYALADIKAATAKFTTVTGNGSSLTSLNGSNITSGTVAAGRVATLNQDTSGNAATATKISSITNSDIVQLTDSQTLTNKTLTSPVLNTGVSGTAIKDEDNMTSDSATHLATQQSIKAYVDSQTSGSSNTGGRQAFSLNNSASGVAVSNSNKTYTITHGMGASLNYGVEVIRAANGSGETVYTDVTRTTTTIVIDFAVAPTAGDYTALVCKY